MILSVCILLFRPHERHVVSPSLPRDRQRRRGGVAQAATDPMDGERIGPPAGVRQRPHRESRGGRGRVRSKGDGGSRRLAGQGQIDRAIETVRRVDGHCVGGCVASPDGL